MAIIVVALVLALLLFSASGNSFSPSLIKYRGLLGLAAACASFAEMIILLELRLYVNVRASHKKKRKEQFVRNIENGFRTQLVSDSSSMGK
jgi:hypothetical protein